MSLSGTLACNNLSLTKLPHTRRLGRTSQSLPNTDHQVPGAADLPNYFTSLVLLAAAIGILGYTPRWNFSHSRGLEDTEISSLLCYCHIIILLSEGTKSMKCGKA